MYICIYTHICVYMYIHIYMYMYIHININMHIYTYIDGNLMVATSHTAQIRGPGIRQINVHAYSLEYIRTYTYIYVYIYIYTYM